MSELFARVLCGIDTTEAGAVAARLACRVTRPEGSLTLVCVHTASHSASTAEEALERARAEAAGVHRVETVLLEGDPFHRLLAERERRDAQLLVVGSHERSRAVGIALGSVATHVLHDAPCAVLLARAPREESHWPRSLVVGVDGSRESTAAIAAARELGERLGAGVRFVAATGDTHVDLERARAAAPELEQLPGRALDELHDLSEHADLVVLGSRGLRGLRALGSISERVAHEARCPVLIVRAARRP